METALAWETLLEETPKIFVKLTSAVKNELALLKKTLLGQFVPSCRTAETDFSSDRGIPKLISKTLDNQMDVFDWKLRREEEQYSSTILLVILWACTEGVC